MSTQTQHQALTQAISVSLELQQQLDGLSTLTDEAADSEQRLQLDRLAAKRDQLIRQAFATAWPAKDVEQYRQEFEQLESLNSELSEQLETERAALLQQRIDNQQGRKAVNAYGNAKNQWQG